LNINFKLIFSLFYEYSIEEFFKSFLIVKNNEYFSYEKFLNESINIALDRKKPSMLQNIYSYFYQDEFAGFILNFKISNIKFEAFFTFNDDFYLETINEPHEWNSNDKCYPKRKYQLLFELIDTIEVSTDFDYREMRCNNYAGLFDEHARPTLVINFRKSIPKNITFYTQWFDPDGRIVDENFWIMTAGYYNYGQFIFQSFNNKSMKPGVWNLKISFNSYYDKRFKYNHYNYIANNDILMIYKFNVLPFKIRHDNINLNNLFKFWTFDSICVEGDSNDETIKICSKHAVWSSYYPDPKSDIFDLF
jgi:hypothetical protein